MNDDGEARGSGRRESGEVDGLPGRPAGAPDDRPSAVPRHADGPVAFVEHTEDGDVEWAVFEVDGSQVAGSRGPRCLLFWREQCVRRVWEYPADWRTFSEVALTDLSRHR